MAPEIADYEQQIGVTEVTSAGIVARNTEDSSRNSKPTYGSRNNRPDFSTDIRVEE